MDNKTGNISDLSSDINDSEMNKYKGKPYEEVKQGKYRVKNRDGSLRCPFCPGKKKQQWKYTDLLQHASGVGSGSVMVVLFGCVPMAAFFFDVSCRVMLLLWTE
ncbi:hypothetical protein C3L33_23374, partial [Rhododendron williamsianum]